MLATLRLVVLVQLIAAGSANPAGKDEAPPGLELLVIHTNDMHARYEQTDRYSGRCSQEEASKGQCFGGYARVAWQIKQARREASVEGPAVLALNAGDTFQGSIYYNVFKSRMAAQLTNMLEFDALSLGNHEFDDGLSELEHFVEAVRAPVLAANVDLRDAPARLRGLVKPSVVLDIRGTRVGVIGYVTPDTKILSKPEAARFVDEITELSSEAERLHAEGVHIIIALGHSGYPMDKAIAERVPHIDLVVGGHSHSFLYTGTQPDVEAPVGLYPTFVRQPSGREVPVVQAYAYTKYLGRLKIRFDANGEIASRTDVQGSPVLLNGSTSQDPDVDIEVGRWRKQLDEAVNRPLGTSLTFLNGTCRSYECNLGNLVSDALVHYRAVRYHGPGWTDAPIGIQNGGNIRSSISVSGNGTVTLIDVMEACPFENFLVIVYLRGDVLVKMLENSVAQYDVTGQYEKGAFLQFSGLHVKYDILAPPGQRVLSARARCGNCSVPHYSPVEPGALYGVIANDFLVDGGDGYHMLTGAEKLTLADITPYSALAEYITDQKVIYPAVENRIVFERQRPIPIRSHASPAHVQSSLIVFLLVAWSAMNR